GAQVPLDTVFRDEAEQPVALRDCLSGKPTILVPVYYRCPMLCTKILNGLVDALRDMPADFTVGRQFNVVTVSMDPKEHSSLAAEKKKAYVGEYGRPGAEYGWRFLTGTKEACKTLLDSVGFRYEFDKMLKEYDHPSALIVLSPTGKVTRYFYGITYDGEFEQPAGATWAGTGPRPELTEAELRARNNPDPDKRRTYTKPTTTLRLSLIEANEGKGGSLVDQVMMLCYRYDSLHKGYSLNVLRVVQAGGILTLAAVGTGVFLMMRRDRRARANPSGPAGPAAPGAGAADQTNALPSGGAA
ncbi:MAG: SCO family protein, partial [Gemmata sp.]